ncbi:MAG: hypothetical protein V7641_4185 [Blastocatellia bacterium]
MKEKVLNLRRLCWKSFMLMTLLACTFFVTSPSYARDPITCQRGCFGSFVGCCGFSAYCTSDCSGTYISCGAGCGFFMGKNCYDKEYKAYKACFNAGNGACAAGDEDCCAQEANEVLSACLYP